MYIYRYMCAYVNLKEYKVCPFSLVVLVGCLKLQAAVKTYPGGFYTAHLKLLSVLHSCFIYT